MNTNTIYDVVILGGGIAGWLTSLFVQKIYPNLKIILIENSEHLPIIAGESGATTFNDILNYLNIDIQDFQKKTNATPKLGGKFYNWSEKTDFIHSLQTDYSPWLDNYEKFDNDLKIISYINNNKTIYCLISTRKVYKIGPDLKEDSKILPKSK